MKQIQVVHLKKLGFSEESYAVVASGFSGRHLWSTAKKLVQEVKANECEQITNPVGVSGSKTDSWLLVKVKDVAVHLLLDEYRYDLDLEHRWLNPPPDELLKEHKVYEKLKRQSDRLDPNEHAWGREDGHY